MTFLGMILVVLLLLRVFSVPKVPKERTLEAYIKRYPGCFQQGRITCYRCGASSLWMKQDRAYPGGVVYFTQASSAPHSIGGRIGARRL